jgi:RNA polymerase sigma-70 factor, ECF subfamily
MSAALSEHSTTSLSLLENLRGGDDQSAWRAFFTRYSPLLFNVGKRLGLSDTDAHDAVQDTLLAVHGEFRSLKGPFDRTKGGFKAWLCGVARHKVLEVRRRVQRIEHAERATGDLDHEPASRNGSAKSKPPPDELNAAFEVEWRRHILTQALQRVASETDPAVYQAFMLYAIEGQPPAKVARLLEISRNAVYISKTRVLQRLRDAIAQVQAEEG